MCLIVWKRDSLTEASEDIPVYKVYVRRSNGMHYSPYAEKCAGCLNPGDVLSDELHVLRRVQGYGDQDNIHGGVCSTPSHPSMMSSSRHTTNCAWSM